MYIINAVERAAPSSDLASQLPGKLCEKLGRWAEVDAHARSLHLRSCTRHFPCNAMQAANST
jgi:hypothetical protein